ncbi:MAG: alanine--tRNA ligase, partial [Gemmatimonadaceae bacterium]
IRQRFLDYFEKQSHAVRPSSSLVPADDPTLLFVNAGMVQFKRVFLGQEKVDFGPRAATSQKCVRAGGKHNDLEQVGHTARHHTFFEMLGNFSFGDYFKRDAIYFAWEFLTKDMGLDADHLRVSVFEEDDEAWALWREVTGIPDSRIYGLGAHDNFWQMADTGPCGPCSEIYVDLASVATDWQFPDGASGEWTEMDRRDFSTEAFVEGAEAGRFLEIWNLVFMQYDRQTDGELKPLPRPSVDTGMGLERIAAVKQQVTNNYHTDLFAPLIQSIEAVTGVRYRGRSTVEPYWHEMGRGSGATHSAAVKQGGRVLVDPADFRVIADHSRAVAFLLADGVFPSNEGRGYVLRRILRRAVRHAWLLGRAAPTLVEVVKRVIELMGELYPELKEREKHIIETTLAEEQRFLATIDGGMKRFDELAPEQSTQGSDALRGTISGDDAFRLYDTFGFPLDLTELMARERGYTVDVDGFNSALGAQRTQSQEERKTRKLGVGADELADSSWVTDDEVTFVGYERIEADTEITAVRALPEGRVAVMLRETPFYSESGGQVSDKGSIVGDGWSIDVDEVRKIDGRPTAIGTAEGKVETGRARAMVKRDARLDTERNHTATHLLHAALRQVLGDHVHQAGSLVAPDRLRFDFAHHGPLTDTQLQKVEDIVNRGVLAAIPLDVREKSYAEAKAAGAMALFGEKYGDVVRVVSVPGVSLELCGGTHVRNTAEIGLFQLVGETGVAAGVRRIEAVTGPLAYQLILDRRQTLEQVSGMLKATPATVVRRLEALMEERRTLGKKLEESVRTGGGSGVEALISRATNVGGVTVVAATVPALDMKSLQSLGDAVREKIGSGVAVLGASFEDGRNSIVGIVTDDLRERGLRADTIIRDVAAVAGGRGGGKPHMAQAGIPDEARLHDALAAVESVVQAHLAS